MTEELRLTNDSGWREEFSLDEAVRAIANEGDDVDDRLNAVSRLIAAMLEKLPSEEAIQILNKASWRHNWRRLTEEPQCPK